MVARFRYARAGDHNYVHFIVPLPCGFNFLGARQRYTSVCEQLAQVSYVVAYFPGFEPATSRLDRQSQRHAARLFLFHWYIHYEKIAINFSIV